MLYRKSQAEKDFRVLAEEVIPGIKTKARTKGRPAMNQNLKRPTTQELQAALKLLGVCHVAPIDDPDPATLMRELQLYQLQLELQSRELRSSQLQLEVARDRYQRLYDHAPVGYLTLNRSGCILQANLHAARTLGEESSEIIGKDFSHWVDADCHQHFQEHLEQVFSGSQMSETELRLRCSGERRCEIQLISEVVCSRGPGAEYCRTAFFDITRYKDAQYFLNRELGETRQQLLHEIEQRKLLQEQLSASERKYRLLLNGAISV